MQAPSARNYQPWQFVVIDDREILDRIPKIHPYAEMMKQARKKMWGNKKGFSLIELIAVLLIIAILAAVGIPVYVKQVETARAADAISTISAIKSAAKQYRQKYGKIPSDVEALEKKGFLELDKATKSKWRFEFTKTRDEIQTITATSTELMDGGSGHSVKFNAETGKISGYGQGDE